MVELLGHGWHVNLQKPMCNDLADAQRMLDAAKANDRVLRVMENYLFYEPLQRLKATVEAGTLGEVAGYHLKMVGSGRGGWDVPMSSYEWQFHQMRNGRGILVFDDGWHKLATALWLFGPVVEVTGMDRQHRGGAGHRDGRAHDDLLGARQRDPRRVGHHPRHRHVPPLRLLHERRALGGHRPARVRARQPLHGPRCPAAEPRGLHRRRAARSSTPSTTTGRSSFRDSGRHWLRWLHTGDGPLWWSGEDALDVLRFALAAYESSAAGGIGIDPRTVT